MESCNEVTNVNVNDKQNTYYDAKPVQLTTFGTGELKYLPMEMPWLLNNLWTIIRQPNRWPLPCNSC